MYTLTVWPHSFMGGVLFGQAADRNRIYFSDTNGFHTNTTLIDGSTCIGGIVTAIEPNSGQILWQWCGNCRAKRSTSFPGRKIPPLSSSMRSNRRSEEHTSELQSLMRISYAVFCLKKKKP